MTDVQPEPGRRRGEIIPARSGAHIYTQITDVLRSGGVPLESVPSSTAGRPLRVAFVVPRFGFGSGGHGVVFQLGLQLEQRGHIVSYWVHDPHGEELERNAELGVTVRRTYAPVAGPVHHGLDEWAGADIVIATGWQTVYPVMDLPLCRARAYLVNDHEPEFSATSVESLFAARTYELGVPCIVGGGPWLEDLLRDRYQVQVVARFPYPTDPELRPRPVPRRDDTIVVYGRDSTPRRAVGLALIAMEELKRRRPDLRIVLFGDQGMPHLQFAYEHLGRATPQELSWVYSEASVGVAFSLTHGSLVPSDMMACGLPVVDLEGYGTAAEHAATGLVELARADPHAIADAIERLLDDPAERERRSIGGRAHATAHDWSDAADHVEEGLRTILSERAAASA